MFTFASCIFVSFWCEHEDGWKREERARQLTGRYSAMPMPDIGDGVILRGL
jgi:hypothetical protein